MIIIGNKSELTLGLIKGLNSSNKVLFKEGLIAPSEVSFETIHLYKVIFICLTEISSDYEVIQKIREKNRTAQLIVIGSYDEEEYQAAIINKGANEYFKFTTSISKILSCIK